MPGNSTTNWWGFPPLTCEVQFDEKWSFVGKKAKNCDPDDSADDFQGDCWDHVAFDPESRLVLAVVPGARDVEAVEEVVDELKQRTDRNVLKLVTSDEYPAYETALLNAFGEEVTTTATGRAARAYEKLPPLNIFRMMGHSGELIDGFTKLGTQILNFTSLDPVLREIAIIRVGVLSKAGYEVFQHERIARRMGMSDALIAAIHEGPTAAELDEAQREVMTYTDDVVANVRAGDATFERPATLEECFAIASEHPEACWIAGGTDMSVEANLKSRRWPYLVSLEGVAELRQFYGHTELGVHAKVVEGGRFELGDSIEVLGD